MPSFDENFEAVRGKIHAVNFADDFERRRNSLLYYWNCAEPLFHSAKIIWSAHGPSDVAAMLVGMSIELLLKGIHVAFDKTFSKTHNLHELCAEIGIPVDQNDIIILQALSENIYWASRYPNPNNAEQLFRAAKIFDKQRRKSGNLASRDIEERSLSRKNCERLWTVFANYYHKAREARLESIELRHGA
jgi:HEPN domain-containing protein